MTEEMTNNDETFETLDQILTDIVYAGRNMERIIEEYHPKKLDPAKIKAVIIHLNKASSLLREKIKPLLSEEDRDW